MIFSTSVFTREVRRVRSSEARAEADWSSRATTSTRTWLVVVASLTTASVITRNGSEAYWPGVMPPGCVLRNRTRTLCTSAASTGAGSVSTVVVVTGVLKSASPSYQ